MNVRSGGEEVGVSVTEVAGAALIETLCNTHAGAMNKNACESRKDTFATIKVREIGMR